jgi:glycosyltransferase involved in cell wall biosynthesis
VGDGNDCSELRFRKIVSVVNPVKVVYIIGSLDIGGAEGQLLELLKNIDRTRFDPSLVLFNGATANRAKNLVNEVYDLRMPSNMHCRLGSKIVKAVRAIARLSPYLRRRRPHIVQAILPASAILAVPAAMLARVPILIGSRRSLVDCYRTTRLLAMADRTATRRCGVMLGNGKAIVQEIIDLDGLPSGRVIRIPNGVDTGKFCPGNRKERRRYGWAEENVVFGIIANFIPYKRHIDFVLAAEQIAKVNPNARFVMAGNDPRGILESLKVEIRSRHLETIFTIIAGTANPEHLYPAMDVYICTSDTEGLSNVLLEAGASGLPLVATRVGGNSEVVEDGYNGFLVEPRTHNVIASAALKLASNMNMRQQMGARSRERICSEFSIKTMVNAHEELYEQLLSGVLPYKADHRDRSLEI